MSNYVKDLLDTTLVKGKVVVSSEGFGTIFIVSGEPLGAGGPGEATLAAPSSGPSS